MVRDSIRFFHCKVEGGETLMEILLSVLESTLTVFFTTLAVGYATRILNKKNKAKKNSPAPRKRKGSSSRK